MYPLALNYNPSANVNRGCIFRRAGCDDPTARNYDSSVTMAEKWQCKYDKTGCAMPGALNYNSKVTATTACVFQRVGCKDSRALNFANDVTEEDTSMCR